MDRSIPNSWKPRKDLPTYVLTVLVLLFELPVLVVLAVGAVLTRAVAGLGRAVRGRDRRARAGLEE